MRSDFVTWGDVPSTPVSEANAAVRAVQALGWPDPLILGVAPAARGNPFQSQLYRRFGREGVATVDLNRAASFTRLAPLARDHAVAVHFHWLSFVLAQAENEREASEAVARFRGELESLIVEGITVAWTLHNRLPHDARFVEREIEIRRAVSEHASVVHVMSKASVDAVADVVEVDPAKVVFSPHPNYRGCYPDHVTREDARRTLGIEPDEAVLVLFGAIKPYKGLNHLLPALDSVRKGRCRLRLVVAGASDDSPTTQRFVEQCLVHPDVLVAPTRVPTEHVQYYLRAADAGLAPYDRVLNSGAAMLYSSFGLPTVVPDVPTVRETLLPEGHVAFRAGDVDDLARAMQDVTEMASEDLSRRVAAHAELFDADVLSENLARAFRGRMVGERDV